MGALSFLFATSLFTIYAISMSIGGTFPIVIMDYLVGEEISPLYILCKSSVIVLFTWMGTLNVWYSQASRWSASLLGILALLFLGYHFHDIQNLGSRVLMFAEVGVVAWILFAILTNKKGKNFY